MEEWMTLRQFESEQIEKDPGFAKLLAEAQIETNFAVSVALLRERAGLTQRELADRAGIKQPMLARIERGQIPTVPTLRKLANALNARVVITGEGGVVMEPLKKAKASRRAKPAAGGRSRGASAGVEGG
jgi:ribosome-binding protein aMBF1 (putative translation factor)